MKNFFGIFSFGAAGSKFLNVEGHFIELGVFDFIKDKPVQVIISNADTDGFVSIDAVQFVPAEPIAASEHFSPPQ
jgi:hypothetical protein